MSTSLEEDLEELQVLIKEQAKDLRYGAHVYYEQGVALSLDALAGEGKYPTTLGATLRLEDRGGSFLFAPRPPSPRLRASSPSCPIHGLANMSVFTTHSPYCNICKAEARRLKYALARGPEWTPRKEGDACSHDWPKYAQPSKTDGRLRCTECKKESWQRTQTSPEARDRRNARRRELYGKNKMGDRKKEACLD